MDQSFDEKLSFITALALNQKELNGIVCVLREIAEAVGACGCVLWETDPWTNVKAEPHTGKLHVFARWMCDEIKMPLRELPISGSANGLAIQREKTISKKDIRIDPDTYKENSWIYDVEMTSLCAVPIKFDSDHYNATLSIYRRREVKPFNSDERKFIEQMANLIPPLYQAIRDKVGRNLLSSINNIVDEAELETKNREAQERIKAEYIESGHNPLHQTQNDGLEEITKAMQKICNAVAGTFQCIETSLFLENSFKAENEFSLVATSYENWTTEKQTYKLERDKDHITCWVLRNKKPVNIFDLGNFEKDKEKLREKYENINWKDSLNIKESAGKILNLPPAELPTLSFMAVPIKKGDKLLGAIRCCTAIKDPWFFAERQVELLNMVAAQISRFWNDWLQHLEEKKEIKVWENFIEKVSELNAKVHKRIDQSDVDENKLFEQILNLAKNSIKNSDILDIRLFDEKTNELYFAKTLGFSRARATRSEIQARREKRFTLDKSSYKKVPLGVLVFEDGIGRAVMDANLEDYKSETFPETQHIVVVPIGIQKEIRGVLDIRGTSSKPFPPRALQMARLLGQQLGLYLFLWESEKQQRQVFEDLFHQTKSPVRYIFARTVDLLQSIDFEQWNIVDDDKIGKIKSKVLMLRGVARKAQKVVFNAGVFKDLSNDGELKLTENKVKPLNYVDTVKMLFEAYRDTELLLDSVMQIKFFVDRNSFARLEKINVNVDADFLEQAINCLLDNAGKYSFAETTVKIKGGEVGKNSTNYFYFSISNEGFEIKADEIPRLTQRYYRGTGAKDSTGEGSGIGLWVVDHIMKAHNGELEILPTNFYGRTEVRLLFPIENK